MVLNSDKSRFWIRLGGYILFWTALGLFFAVQTVLSYTNNGQPARWDGPVLWQVSYWYTWALLAPLLSRIAKRFPLDRGRWKRNLPVLIGFTVVLAPIQVAIATVVRAKSMQYGGVLTAERAAERIAGLDSTLMTGSFDAAFTLWIILGIIYAIDYYRQLQEKEVATSRLQAELAEAHLSNLKAQIQPHFLFNTLNSISALVSEDPAAAERMIARLSDLLRLALDAGHSTFVSVRDEVRLAELYLDIESVRFQDRLRVEMDVDPELLDERVPALVLQPLVENAIKHGVAPYEQDGFVGVRVFRTNGSLELEVEDSGNGFDVRGPEAANGRGIGLTNTRSRLERIYGDRWSMETVRGPDRFCIRLELPCDSIEND